MTLKQGLVLISVFGLMIISACSNKPASQYSQEVPLDSFEGAINKKTVDFGSSKDTKIVVTAAKDKKVCGNQSLQIEYDLNPSGYMYCARGYGLNVFGSVWEGPKPPEITWDKFDGISVQVYGSKSGDIAMDVKDGGGEMWRYLIQDDFNGWKEVFIPFFLFKVREDWQPSTADGNKILDFPIQSFQFEPRKPGPGKVNFDCVKIVKE